MFKEMNEFFIFGLFSLGILLWVLSQTPPSKIYDKQFKQMIEREINEMGRR